MCRPVSDGGYFAAVDGVLKSRTKTSSVSKGRNPRSSATTLNLVEPADPEPSHLVPSRVRESLT